MDPNDSDCDCDVGYGFDSDDDFVDVDQLGVVGSADVDDNPETAEHAAASSVDVVDDESAFDAFAEPVAAELVASVEAASLLVVEP